MSAWNFGDVWEAVADARGDRLVLVQGDDERTWAELDRRADGVAAGLLAAGLERQARVAQYLYSSPEYLESVFACWKAALVPVNTNYRYTGDELVYLWTNAGCAAVVFHGAFTEVVDAVRTRVPSVALWLWVDDGSGPCPAWATPYEDLAAGGRARGRVVADGGRSGDDLLLLYTGGTTGAPKGVMWRQDDLFALLNRNARVRYPEDGGPADVAPALAASPHPAPVGLPCAPLMHGTGLFSSFSVLSAGGTVVLLEGRSFSAVEFLDVVQRRRVTETAIVGDAFAKPILRELDARPDGWDLSSLRVMSSSGVMWAAETKAGLIGHLPSLRCIDSLASSEAIGIAASVTSSKDATARTGGFRLGPATRVITPEGRDVRPGSGERGLLALRGRGPLGYYGDPEKTAATFRLVDGERWTIPGDWAEVAADGEVRLLGRGSVCINTGGEKVFPEEVEEVLKRQDGIRDAVVVGVPDERFGEVVAAVVEPAPGAVVEASAVTAAARAALARYKAPRVVLFVPSLERAPNGKVDYARWRAYAGAQAVAAP